MFQFLKRKLSKPLQSDKGFPGSDDALIMWDVTLEETEWWVPKTSCESRIILQ